MTYNGESIYENSVRARELVVEARCCECGAVVLRGRDDISQDRHGRGRVDQWFHRTIAEIRPENSLTRKCDFTAALQSLTSLLSWFFFRGREVLQHPSHAAVGDRFLCITIGPVHSRHRSAWRSASSSIMHHGSLLSRLFPAMTGSQCSA